MKQVPYDNVRNDLDWREAVSATTAVVNPDQSKYLRVVWVNTRPDWTKLTPLQIAVRAVAINDNFEQMVLMVDTTVICLS